MLDEALGEEVVVVVVGHVSKPESHWDVMKCLPPLQPMSDAQKDLVHYASIVGEMETHGPDAQAGLVVEAVGSDGRAERH